MKKLSVPIRALLFAMAVAVVIPLGLWLIVQFYEWSCATIVTCEPMGKPSQAMEKNTQSMENKPEPMERRSYYPMGKNP